MLLLASLSRNSGDFVLSLSSSAFSESSIARAVFLRTGHVGVHRSVLSYEHRVDHSRHRRRFVETISSTTHANFSAS